jgi:malonyl-CoA/methylmalonyl-CoA synthetase
MTTTIPPPPAAQPDASLFTALRAAFPADLDAVAIDAADAAPPRRRRWREIDAASARIANLLGSLDLPADARIGAQVGKSVEALTLYLGVLRAGFVFMPLNTADQAAEIDYFIGNAEPAVMVCSPGNLHWVAPLARAAGTAHVFTLGEDGSGTLLDRAADFGDTQQPAPRGPQDLACRHPRLPAFEAAIDRLGGG